MRLSRLTRPKRKRLTNFGFVARVILHKELLRKATPRLKLPTTTSRTMLAGDTLACPKSNLRRI